IFRATDPMWLYASGRWHGTPPVIRGEVDLRPRAHSKSSDKVCSALHAMTFATRKLNLIGVASDRDQAAVLAGAAEAWVSANPFLRDALTTQQWAVVNANERSPAYGSKLTILSSD